MVVIMFRLRFQFAMLLCLLVIFQCGCGRIETSSNLSSHSLPPTENASPTKSYQLLCDRIIGCAGSGTKDGFYRVLNNLDGTGNIVYYDYSTRQLIFLSSQVNSTHKDSDDTSFLSSVIGGTATLSDGEKLYILKQTNDVLIRKGDMRGRGYICCLDLNGQNRQTIQLPTNQYIIPTSGVACSAQELYFLIQETGDNAQTHTKLLSTNFEKESLSVEYTFEESVIPFLVGQCSKGLIFQLRNVNEGKNVFAIWNNTLQAPVELAFDASANECVFDNEKGQLYYTPHSNPLKLYRYDISTDHSDEISSIPQLDGYDQLLFSSTVRDQHIFIQLANSTTGDVLRYAIDLKSREWKPQTLQDGDHDVQIFAHSEKEYFVRLEDSEVDYQDYLPDGTPVTNQMLMPNYVLIAKEDYWKNKPDYIRFDDEVFDALDLKVPAQQNEG